MHEQVELRTRIISSDNKYSFQVYNGVNNQNIWMASEWWDTALAAQTACEQAKARVIDDMRAFGYSVTRKDGADIITLPTYTTNEQNVTALAVLAVERNTGRFGFVIADVGTNQVYIKPKAYFDTPEEVLNVAVKTKDEIIAELKTSMPTKNVTFITPEKNNFIPANLIEAIEEIKRSTTKHLSELAGKDVVGQLMIPNDELADNQTNTLKHFGLKGFDRSVN